MEPLDSKDRALLQELQRDARLSNNELARLINLSPSPCWRRVKRLEDEGIITGYVALLDARVVGLPVLAYAHVSLENHHADTVEGFDALIRDIPEVLECSSMAGEYDYLLKVRTSSLEAYEDFLRQKLLRHAAVRAVNTSFVLSQQKFTTALPL
jgi:DNA-binding Lrp family transcriptional regulator